MTASMRPYKVEPGSANSVPAQVALAGAARPRLLRSPHRERFRTAMGEGRGNVGSKLD